jgi:hypothetical protein
MKSKALCFALLLSLSLSLLTVQGRSRAASAPNLNHIESPDLAVETSLSGETYTLRSRQNQRVFLTAHVAAQVNHRWISSSDYPHHAVTQASVTDDWTPNASAAQLTIAHSGRPGDPDLICLITLHSQPAFAEIRVRVRNTTSAPLTVQSLRALDAADPVVHLDGPVSSDRILSDSFSEDRPDMELHDAALPSLDGLHLAVGSQLIYNRSSRQSLFVGALSSDKFLTVLHLHVDPRQARFTGYEVDSEGTSELAENNSLRNSPKEDRVELSLPLPPGAALSSEPIALSLSRDYHMQLESYGALIRALHHARVSAPTPLGWWSWTAYYFGITDGAALSNAQVLAAHLKDFGYNFFHIDEGYQFARGDYTSPVAHKFPNGVKHLEDQVRALGLTPGIWTAPFEIAERSSVYVHHKDWLVHNAQGRPIHAGFVTSPPDTDTDLDPLYVLDTTNPAAQQYLRDTYATLTRDWGIRYIKLDFMDDTAIEGYYHRPNTTAMEAQRIGLQVIRDAVGDGVLLDKDGSVMINPVGLVDIGRISSDTGHSFDASRGAAPGIAARYYMNRNYFLADPDAFTVSRQLIGETQNHGAQKPLSLDEAKVSIALSAISGGLFEIGDDLPTLFADADRMALVENSDLLNVARYGHSATPLDLMSYDADDEMPSIFLLRESDRQSILTVFNWTGKERSHQFSFSDLGLASSQYQVVDVFSPSPRIADDIDTLAIKLPPQSVRVFKILDASIAASAPSIQAKVPATCTVGKLTDFSAAPSSNGVPSISYRWDFGDGASAEGISAAHTYTHEGPFTARLTAEGIEGKPFEKEFPIACSGEIDTIFRPGVYRRYQERP